MQEKDAREENTGVSKSSNMESKQEVTRKTMAGDLYEAILTYLPPGLTYVHARPIRKASVSCSPCTPRPRFVLNS